jgi:histidinol-phosphate aminotransferase
MIVQAAGGENVVVPLRDWRYDLKAMASRITGKTRLIFIANPNNPTGTINTRDEVDAFIEQVPEGVLVVLDEAYYEYVSSPDYADGMEYFRRGRDVLVLRTFSKIYGLAGLRIGYGFAKAPIVSDMDRVRQPFNINSLAQKAVRAALTDEGHIARAKRINERGKKYLYKELKALNIQYVPTEANFIYLTLSEDSSGRIYNDLLRMGVIVRPMGPREIRVTIGLPRENRRFIEAMKSVIRDV